jgi:hypothetical protein
MRLALAAMLGTSFLGCTGAGGAPGVQGASGPTGPMGPGAQGISVGFSGGSSGDGGFHCAPGSFLCVGSRIWSCTLSGLDAVGGLDCASATVPSSCQASGCPDDAGACCVKNKSSCGWDQTEPWTITAWSTPRPLGKKWTRSRTCVYPDASKGTETEEAPSKDGPWKPPPGRGGP